MPLLVGIDHTHLDPPVAQAFDELIAAIQTWSASPVGLSLPRMRAYLSTTQAIVSGTDPAVLTTWRTADLGTSFPERSYDTGGLLDTTSGHVTLAVAGVYLLQASVAWQANAVGFRYIGIFKDNQTTLASLSAIALTQIAASSAGNQVIMATPSVIVPVLDPPQRYYVGVFQSSGGNLNAIADTVNTWFQVTKIG